MSQSNGHSNRSDRSNRNRSNSSNRGDRKPSPHQPVILSADEIARLLVPSAGRQRLVVMVGIPGSGKSTIAGVIEKQGGYVRLSFDDVRAQLFGNAESHGLVVVAIRGVVTQQAEPPMQFACAHTQCQQLLNQIWK